MMGDRSLDDKISLLQAQDKFENIIEIINENSLGKFLDWIDFHYLSECKQNQNANDTLEVVAQYIKEKIPFQAVLPSETIKIPTVGENSKCDSEHTVHVDAFLYDDEALDNLYEEEHLDRYYCVQCGCRKTKPLSFISHSMSKDQLAHIFQVLLPPLDGQVLLDIGSRLGTVLYGAFVYTLASKIVGVEMNDDFCKLQWDVLEKFQFQDRIEIVRDNIFNRPDLVESAQVIILNNVFEFFMETEQHVAMWKFLMKTVKKGTTLVTIPPLHVTLSSLQMENILKEWVEELPMYKVDDSGSGIIISNLIPEIKHYKVL